MSLLLLLLWLLLLLLRPDIGLHGGWWCRVELLLMLVSVTPLMAAVGIDIDIH